MKCYNCYYYRNTSELSKFGNCIYHIVKVDWNGSCSHFKPSVTKVVYDKGRDNCIKCDTKYTKSVKNHYFRKGLDKIKLDNIETKTCNHCNHICFDDNNFRYIVSKLSEVKG